MTDEQPVQCCVCTALHPQELLQAWRRRAAPIFKRMTLHARRVNSGNLDATLDLVQRMHLCDPVCFSPAHAHRSHHLPDCPRSIRNRGRAVKTRSPREVVAEANLPLPRRGMW